MHSEIFHCLLSFPAVSHYPWDRLLHWWEWSCWSWLTFKELLVLHAAAVPSHLPGQLPLPLSRAHVRVHEGEKGNHASTEVWTLQKHLSYLFPFQNKFSGLPCAPSTPDQEANAAGRLRCSDLWGFEPNCQGSSGRTQTHLPLVGLEPTSSPRFLVGLKTTLVPWESTANRETHSQGIELKRMFILSNMHAVPQPDAGGLQCCGRQGLDMLQYSCVGQANHPC